MMGTNLCRQRQMEFSVLTTSSKTWTMDDRGTAPASWLTMMNMATNWMFLQARSPVAHRCLQEVHTIRISESSNQCTHGPPSRHESLTRTRDQRKNKVVVPTKVEEEIHGVSILPKMIGCRTTMVNTTEGKARTKSTVMAMTSMRGCEELQLAQD